MNLAVKREFWNRKAPKRSLKTRMTLFVLVVFLVSIWSLFVYESRILHEDVTGILGQQQFSTASIIAKSISSEFDIRFKTLQEAAREMSLYMMDHAALQSALEEYSELLYLFNGGIIITDGTGHAIADLPYSTGRIGQYYGDDPWVSGALHDGRSSVGHPIMGKVLGVPVFGMTVPVFDQNGDIIGSIGGVVEIEEMTFMDGIAGSRYGGGGGYMIIAPEYRLIVTASDKKNVLETLPEEGKNPDFDRLLQSDEGLCSILSGLEGEDVLISMDIISATGWRVIVSLPTREAFVPIRDLQHRSLLATILLTLIAGALTWWMLRRQLLPLSQAVYTLAHLSVSDLPVQNLPVKRQDEVGELIQGFNRLLDTLRKREISLNESHEIL